MVKIPGMDDLKKMGTGLIDSAKSVKIGEMVDKLKSGIESTVVSKKSVVPQSSEAVKKLFEGLYAELDLLKAEQTKMANSVKKIQDQLVELANAFDAMSSQSEEKK